MAEDIDELTEWALSQGYRVEYSADGYRHFYTPDDRHVGYYPATPSRPARRFARLVVDLRKAGLEWPPPSKKEQRSRRRKEGQ